jgi:cytochrome c oxidase cbb3-type subunit 3
MMRAPLVFLGAMLALGCHREKREFAGLAYGASLAELAPETSLAPAGAAADFSGVRAVPPGYDETAYDISQGQQLFLWFNCNGCHAHGGGGIGVALMDGTWIYGSRPDDIFASIVAGRPKGMPSYRGKLTHRQAWQLVAYVRSLSGNVRKDAVSGRSDSMQATPPPPISPAQAPAPPPGGGP